MSKKIMILFIPIFDVLFSLVIPFVKGTPLLLMILFQDIIIPILFISSVFAVANSSKNDVKGKYRYMIVSVVMYVIAIIINAILLYGKWSEWHLPFKIIWLVICTLLFLLYNAVRYNENNKIFNKTAFSIEACVLLFINAFATYILSGLSPLNRVDAIEIILMPTTICLLCIFSYHLGRVMKKSKIALKMGVWVVGVLVSEFITLYLLGTPHSPPTSNVVSMVIWLTATAIVFCFCILGVILSRRADWEKETK